MRGPDTSQAAAGLYADEIRTLTSMTGFPECEVRPLFEKEFARLSAGATIATYLTVRTMTNVLSILRSRSGSVTLPLNGPSDTCR